MAIASNGGNGVNGGVAKKYGAQNQRKKRIISAATIGVAASILSVIVNVA